MRDTRPRRTILALLAAALLSLALGVPAAADLGSGDVALVAYTEGDGLNLRYAPSLNASVVAGMPEGAVVTILEAGIVDDTSMAWARVSYQGLEGYAAAAFLAEAASAGPTPTPDTSDDTPDASGELVIGGWAAVSGTNGDGLNAREGPGTDAAVITTLPEGTLALLLDGPSDDGAGDLWYQVDAAGVVGWVHGGYLAPASPAPGVDPAPDDDPALSGDAVGAAIVAEALNHLGAPYLWAGTTPEGFDCSGFVYYVINTVLHNDFPRAIEDQVVSGAYVNLEELQPGDLVFFENTYTWGLSHVGIYVGDGQFINAGSEWDNVAISDMTQEYWATRYVTARRVR